MIINGLQAFWWDAARTTNEDDYTFPLYEKAPLSQKCGKGKRRFSETRRKSGYSIQSIPAAGDYSDPALTATLRRAALQQLQRRKEYQPERPVIIVKPCDVMKKVRVCKNRSLMVFLVDLSWSMAVTRRMQATKQAITGILTKAYQYRDDVCLITFQKEQAEVVIPPTHSVTLAEKAMKRLQVGGKTPLSRGLKEAERLMAQERKNYDSEHIRLVLLSDCDGNVPLDPAKDPWEEAVAGAEKIAGYGFRSLVINSDSMTFGQGKANHLAKALHASCYLMADMNADYLLNTLSKELIL